MIEVLGVNRCLKVVWSLLHKLGLQNLSPCISDSGSSVHVGNDPKVSLLALSII